MEEMIRAGKSNAHCNGELYWTLEELASKERHSVGPGGQQTARSPCRGGRGKYRKDGVRSEKGEMAARSQKAERSGNYCLSC